MSYKLKNQYRHKFKPMKFRVTNWQQYNQALRDRGDLTNWFDDRAIKHWYAKNKGKPGDQKIYSNLAIETAGIIKLVFNLPLRQTQGFMHSMTKLMGLNLRIPDYSTLLRRMKKLNVNLTPDHIRKKGTHIIIDSTGLSVYGADEFFRSKKGKVRVKDYRRLHIAMNEHQQIIANELTTPHKNEQPQVPKLLKKSQDHCECIMPDRNYDHKSVYRAIEKYRPTRFVRRVEHDRYQVIIPPRRNAIIRSESEGCPDSRNEHIKIIADVGLMK